MNPMLVPLALRALKLLIAIPKMRSALATTVAAEGMDVGPEVVNALSGDAQAIKLFSDQIDEARAENLRIQQRLEAQVRAERREP
jgi:hypothetical protein